MCGVCTILWSYFTSTLFRSNFIDENMAYTFFLHTSPTVEALLLCAIHSGFKPTIMHLYEIILYPSFVLKACQLSCSKKANCIQACRSLYTYRICAWFSICHHYQTNTNSFQSAPEDSQRCFFLPQSEVPLGFTKVLHACKCWLISPCLLKALLSEVMSVQANELWGMHSLYHQIKKEG